MSKWLWCGALVVVLGAGATAVKKHWWAARPNVAIGNRQEPKPQPIGIGTLAPPRSIPPASSVAPAPALAEFDEPIVTRTELLESTREINATLPTSGGAEESEAVATLTPRPDLETRRMPYADDEDHHEFAELLFRMRNSYRRGAQDLTPHVVREPADLLSWSGILRWALGLRRLDMAGAEESEEPPLLEPVRLHHDHLPHFPGYCPFPHRQLPPR